MKGLKENLVGCIGEEKINQLDLEAIEKFIERDVEENGNYHIEDEFYINEEVVKVIYIAEVEVKEVEEDCFTTEIEIIECYLR